MGTSGKKQSFSLPSFRRSSAGDQRQEVAARSSAEEAARVRKAAAWQWYTRGVGEGVAPTKRPPVGNLLPPQVPIDIKSAVDGRSKGGEAIIHDGNALQKSKPSEFPLAESPRSASRFKAEAGLTARRPASSDARPPPSAPSAARPPTPLYDELELSGLRSQMANFVQRLQHQSPAVADHQPPIPAATSVSTDQQTTKVPPPVAAAYTSIGDHQLTSLPPSAAPVASRIPFHTRPFYALHRLFRKVVTGSIMKSGTKNSAQDINSSPAVYHETEVLPPEDNIDDNTQYHYHHYIHHHHHHYHYAQSPEERAATIRSLRRHSESSGIRPPIPGQWEAASDEDDEEAEESPIAAYLARRRRHSDSFAGQVPRKTEGFDEDEGIKEESAQAEKMQLPRKYDSERLTPSGIPTVVSKDMARHAAESKYELDGGRNVDMRSRRRHSAETYQEEVSLERTPEGGGKSGGGTYKLGRAAGGAALGKPVIRRRHSEVGSAERTTPPGRLCWNSPSARHSLDLPERHSIGVPVHANVTPFRPPVAPRLYPL